MGWIALSLFLGCSPSSDAPTPPSAQGLAPSVSGEAEPPRLVLLYAPCTVNKDFLSPYAPSIGYTPSLEAFARDSVVFRRHQTEAGQSGIAYASLFSGAQADRHGAFRHPLRLADDLYLVSEAFADQGYETFFWNGHALGGPNYGQGVPADNLFRGGDGLQASDPKFVAILERLKADPDYKAFVMTNFTVTHGPYRLNAAKPFRERYPAEASKASPKDSQRLYPIYRRNHIGLAFDYEATVERIGLTDGDRSQLSDLLELLYKSGVHELDARFGAVLEAVDSRGLRDESLVVFTADHGELLEQEGEVFRWSHAMQITPEVAGVPLLVRSADPRLESGPYEGVTRSIDVYPTLAGLAGFALPQDRGIQGVDLSPALRGEVEAPELVALSHTTLLVHSVFQRMLDPKHAHNWALVQRYFPDEGAQHMWVALREGDRLTRWKKRSDGEWVFESLDLGADASRAWQAVDPENPSQAATVERLRQYKSRLVAGHARAQAGESLLPAAEEIEALQGLGYIE
jgi:arylsulfatase A-like enzyme